MSLPSAEQLRHDPRFRAARTHWIINALFAWISVVGFVLTLVWVGLSLFGSASWLTVTFFFGASIFASYVAREYRRASARAIATAAGLSGVPLVMERWGEPSIAGNALKRADAWHAERYGGKSAAELEALAKEDAALQRELEDWDKRASGDS